MSNITHRVGKLLKWVITIFSLQDFSQLKKDHGKDQAGVNIDITINISSNQMQVRSLNNYQIVLEKSFRPEPLRQLIVEILQYVNQNGSIQKYRVLKFFRLVGESSKV